MSSILLRQLFQRSKEHKLRFQEDDAVVVGSPYHTMRRSPGGPDPAHHWNWITILKNIPWETWNAEHIRFVIPLFDCGGLVWSAGTPEKWFTVF